MLFSIAAQIVAQQQPKILQIYRDFVSPGNEAAYAENERQLARQCAELGFPHPYLALEALSGPKEVWFLNGWNSPAEQDAVAAEYASKPALVAALEAGGKRKTTLVLKPIEAFANYRPESSRGTQWSMGAGRFLVITLTKAEINAEGTVFETMAGEKFIFQPARSRTDADRRAKTLGPDSRVFTVRPEWSLPAKQWIEADPALWRLNSPARAR
jgi:hypothetical protein